MLEKTITIGDKQVKFRSSATIPRLYRQVHCLALHQQVRIHRA